MYQNVRGGGVAPEGVAVGIQEKQERVVKYAGGSSPGVDGGEVVCYTRLTIFLE
jgi:hypothetical protein